MKNIKKYMADYLQSKQLAWAPSTQKSEEARLSAVIDDLNGDAEALWKLLVSRDMAPYARLTTWIRVTNFWGYLNAQGHVRGNPYQVFKEMNARLFKHTYQPKKPEISYEEAEARIKEIEDESIRRRALEILGSGMRWTESGTHSHGGVSGKGSKNREVYVPEVGGPEYHGTYQTFRRALGKVGLKPHDLRKLFLTKLVELGANEFELMEAAGWESISPARSYINVNKAALKARVRKLQKGEK